MFERLTSMLGAPANEIYIRIGKLTPSIFSQSE